MVEVIHVPPIFRAIYKEEVQAFSIAKNHLKDISNECVESTRKEDTQTSAATESMGTAGEPLDQVRIEQDGYN